VYAERVEVSRLRRRRGRGLDNASKNSLFAFVVFLVIPIALLNAALVGLGLPEKSNVTAGIAIFLYLIAVGVVVWVKRRSAEVANLEKRKVEEERNLRLQQRREQQEQERRRKHEQLEEERRREEQERAERKRQMEEERRKREEQQEEERRREEQERAEQIEALLERDAFRESVHYMNGVEFENFMANVFDKKGYRVQTTPATGDQGVDLLLTIDDCKVAVQLKRYTPPVGNAAVQQAFTGMIYYKAKEAWVITTSSFTKGARDLAKGTGVRLIDGNELEDWLADLRDEA
jgi:restriction endonuclease Mrr